MILNDSCIIREDYRLCEFQNRYFLSLVSSFHIPDAGLRRDDERMTKNLSTLSSERQTSTDWLTIFDCFALKTALSILHCLQNYIDIKLARSRINYTGN